MHAIHSKQLTWYTADVYTPAILERSQPFMHNVGLGVLPDAAVQRLLLGLQHVRQARMGQTLHYDALHQGTTVIVLDVPHPLQASMTLLRDLSVDQQLHKLSSGKP